MSEPGVEVMWPALSRAWHKAGCTELWLQFRPRGSKDVLDAVEAAVEVANQVAMGAGRGDEVFVEAVFDSDAGPVAWMSRAGSEDGVRSWLVAFAVHLETLGKAGKVTAARHVYLPEWLRSPIDVPRQLTAFVSYRTNDLTPMADLERRGGWHVPAALTERVAEAGTAWGRFEGADVYLSRDVHRIRTKNPDVGRPLADGVTRFGIAGVTYLRSGPPRMASVQLCAQGQACYQVMNDTASWKERLVQAAAAMAGFPEDTDLAFVQYSLPHTISWSELQTGRPLLPYVHEHHIRYNRHLNSSYTPDAHGLQLLTDAHLGHASDLSDWVIEPLGPGKHLVQAKDLQPWYANVDPAPETLMKARADFGDMILTPQTIADNPPPWA